MSLLSEFKEKIKRKFTKNNDFDLDTFLMYPVCAALGNKAPFESNQHFSSVEIQNYGEELTEHLNGWIIAYKLWLFLELLEEVNPAYRDLALNSWDKIHLTSQLKDIQDYEEILTTLLSFVRRLNTKTKESKSNPSVIDLDQEATLLPVEFSIASDFCATFCLSKSFSDEEAIDLISSRGVDVMEMLLNIRKEVSIVYSHMFNLMSQNGLNLDQYKKTA